MISRRLRPYIEDRLKHMPGVVLLGPRQVGKTTLARNIASRRAKSSALYLDLERPADQRRLQDAATFLRTQAGKWVVIDEIHRGPTLFEVLRGIIDDRWAAGERADGAIVLDFPLEAHGFGAVLMVNGQPSTKMVELLGKMQEMTSRPLAS
jgi:hypothetical protein